MRLLVFGRNGVLLGFPSSSVQDVFQLPHQRERHPRQKGWHQRQAETAQPDRHAQCCGHPNARGRG